MTADSPYVKGPSVENREYLAELYHGEGMTVAEIAEKIDRADDTVYRWMRKYDVYDYTGWDE